LRIASIDRTIRSNLQRTFLTPSVLLEAHGTQSAGGAPMRIDRDRPIRFAEVSAESRRVATALSRLGIRHDDRVALCLPNVSAWLSCFFACACVGAIAISVNTRFSSHEVAGIAGRSGARLRVGPAGFKGTDLLSVLSSAAKTSLAALSPVRFAQ